AESLLKALDSNYYQWKRLMRADEVSNKAAFGDSQLRTIPKSSLGIIFNRHIVQSFTTKRGSTGRFNVQKQKRMQKALSFLHAFREFASTNYLNRC
ncbi:MAG: hypothetical protein JXR40_12945, partial [Pontiellaceae bacterium]|nr:hypothetical protein [Pontiellaceae bacterium]